MCECEIVGAVGGIDYSYCVFEETNEELIHSERDRIIPEA